jgi:hypothetical protein
VIGVERNAVSGMQCSGTPSDKYCLREYLLEMGCG